MNFIDEKEKGLKPFELLLDQKAISRKVAELGEQITNDYAHKNPIILGVLKGCIIFMSDLIRHIRLPLELEFISASSYRKGQQQDDISFATVVPIPLKDRHVLIVEGVVDSGRTVTKLLSQINKLEPASVEVVTLIDKPASHRTKLDIKYKGFSVGNEFVIGFGLDNTQKYRNLPFIGKLID